MLRLNRTSVTAWIAVVAVMIVGSRLNSTIVGDGVGLIPLMLAFLISGGVGFVTLSARS